MKTVALLPVKNEAWIIKTYLSSIKPFADSVIALDDGSEDGTIDMLMSEPFVTLYKTSDVLPAESMTDMSARRSFLLSKAREFGATHQIWLDADEAIPALFADQFKEALSLLKPGQKLRMPWVTLWKKSESMRTDSVWRDLRKDFAFCDDGTAAFSSQHLSESRTPETILEEAGKTEAPTDRWTDCNIPVLHFQFVFWERAQAKQAWYRCHELIQGQRSARRINATYSIADDSERVTTSDTPKEWIEKMTLPERDHLRFLAEEATSTYRSRMQEWFNSYGIEYFEGLDIWHIQDLHDIFVSRTGRIPVPSKFPRLVLRLNELRHRITKAIAQR